MPTRPARARLECIHTGRGALQYPFALRILIPFLTGVAQTVSPPQAGDTEEVKVLRRAFPALGWPAVGGEGASEAAAEPPRDLLSAAAVLQEARAI